MKARRTRPVFIVGCARSGTTWLYHLLLSSGGFAIYRSETQFYSRFGPRFSGFSNERQRKAFLDLWLKSEFFLRSGLDAVSFRQEALNDVDSPGSMLGAFMKRICDEQSAERWAECTPDHALYVRRIKRDFPDALFIHIIRDGRDVTMSLVKQAFIKPFPWHTKQPHLVAAAYWAWTTNAVSKQASYLGNDLLTLHYENLLESLDSTLLQIATFIDKPIDPVRIKTYPVGSILEPNSSFERKPGDSGNQYVPRWQEHCTEDTLRVMEEVIGRGLDKFGYQPSTSPPGLVSRIHATLLRLAYFARLRARCTLKQLAIFSRYIPHGLENASVTDDTQDPTMRPKENISFVRRLIGS